MTQQEANMNHHDKVEDNIISFDKSAVKLEYREFSIDDEVTTLNEQLAHKRGVAGPKKMATGSILK